MKKILRGVDKERGILQLTTVDERWYIKNSLDPVTGSPMYRFVPSVTWISGFYPKGIAFYKWLANKGWDEAEAIKAAAGNKGSKVHRAIADLLAGKEVLIESKYVNYETGQEEELTPEEWECIMSFAEWFEATAPEVIAFEYTVWNDEEDYAGTVDLKCRIDGETWIIDLKTGRSIWPEYELQLSAYRHADAEAELSARLGILQLGYERNKTRRWKLTEIEDKFPLFLATKQIWANETAGQVPLQKDYPLAIKLQLEDEGKVEYTDSSNAKHRKTGDGQARRRAKAPAGGEAA